MKLTSWSPSATTSFKLFHQILRGFLRNLSSALPCSLSIVHTTSLAVNGLPSCQITSRRSANVSRVPSSFHAQLVASSGTMASMVLSCFAWSWIEALGGLSHRYMRKVPPAFWANAGLATSAKAAANAAASPTGQWRTLSSLLGALTGCACSTRAATSIASRGREHLRVLGVGRHGRGVASARRRARRSIELLSFARAGSGKQALDLLDEFSVRGKRAPLACHANVGLPGTRIAGQLRQPFAFAGPLQA